ncbi:MAG: hypothetical protein AA908_07715 [Chlorobi bacterium NICIL-2]|nr:MAG: hypothetical protein AA908_07715 [Chlorobi bacterium NICIL-2]
MSSARIVLLVASIAITTSSAQIYRTTAAAGYTATFLVGSTATNLIFTPANNDSGSLYVTGSRFIGAQSGLTVRFLQALDERARWFLPVSVEAIFFRGKQRQENLLYLGRAEVSADMFTLSAGLQYRYADLPLAQAFLYASIEPRLSLVEGPHFLYLVSDKTTGQVIADYSIDTTLKPTVFRAGGALRLGAQGVLEEKVLINLSIAWGAFNLIGRDMRTTDRNRRAGLLTPTTIFQTSEPIEQFLQVSLWVQYPF